MKVGELPPSTNRTAEQHQNGEVSVNFDKSDINLIEILASLQSGEEFSQLDPPERSCTTNNQVNTTGNCTGGPCLNNLNVYIEGNKENNDIFVSDSSESLAKQPTPLRRTGYFCSDTIFNLSGKALSVTEIKVLEKGLGFSPTTSFINEADF